MFRQKIQRKTDKVTYPVGTFLDTEDNHYYVAAEGKRYLFITKRVRDSWNPKLVVPVTEESVKHMKVAAKMLFRNGTLLQNQFDGKIYLVSNNLLRQVVNPDWFCRLNLDRMNALWVSPDEINLHEEGEPLS